MSDFGSLVMIQRLRKVQRCLWCEDRLEVGESAARLSGKQEGIMFTLYLHPQCYEACQRDLCTIEDEACPYPHARGMTCNETTEEHEAHAKTATCHAPV